MISKIQKESWRLAITIYGWGGIAKGVWLTVFPGSVAKFMQVYQKSKTLLLAHSALVIIFGIALTVLGYFSG